MGNAIKPVTSKQKVSLEARNMSIFTQLSSIEQPALHYSF